MSQKRAVSGRSLEASPFRVELLRGADVVATRNARSSTLRATFPVEDLRPGDYSVQVRANAWNYKESLSDKALITVLGSVSPTLAYADNKITATWNDVQPPKAQTRGVGLHPEGS